MKRIFSLLLFLALALIAAAQEGDGKPAEMADALRSNGKIYVVVAVVVTILLGLFIYLFRLDRKITRLEKDTRNS
ncbi:MAG TPA: CcmD family protein [Chitinophagaceae bacterium]|nr:CcmD family protein [Chitinophagaceae bacterium]